MPNELERELERALGEAPGPDPGITDRALQAALAALPSPADTRRVRRRRIALLLAACIAAFVSGGVTLAATDGRLPGIGPALTSNRPDTSGAPARRNAPLVAPGEAISALIGDRGLIVTARRSRTFTDHGLTGFAASPAALYAIEARAGHLRAIQAATGRVAWRFRAAGTPADPVWAPFPIRVAYLLHGRHGLEVHDIWGNGTHDFTVHAPAAPVAPSWRWDSKAFAFVRSDGVVVVHDVIGGSDVALRPACGLRTAAAVAFAPSGGRLAIADRHGHLRVVDTTGHAPALCTTVARGLPSIGWLGPNQLLAGAGSTLSRIVIHRVGTGYDATTTPGTIAGLAVSPDHRKIVVALESGGRRRVVIAATPRFSEESGPLRILRALANGPVAGPRRVPLSWL
jgi:hypothetical protein